MYAETGDRTTNHSGASEPQSLATEHFFYFFLRLRKPEIRRTVQALRTRYPNETSEQLARRIIDSYTSLSFLGGTLMHLPLLLPGIGQALQLLGFVGGASALTRMHLYLILEIALAYGKDIDDEARVSEMIAVVAGTGLAAGTPLALQALNINPLLALPASGMTAAAVAHLIGETAIQYYARETTEVRSAPLGPVVAEIRATSLPEAAEGVGTGQVEPSTEAAEAPLPSSLSTSPRVPSPAPFDVPGRRRQRPHRAKPSTA